MRQLHQKIGYLAPVNVEELRVAEVEIIKAVQREAFPKEIALLRQTIGPNQVNVGLTSKKGPLKKMSPIRKLDPFMDQDGILRSRWPNQTC